MEKYKTCEPDINTALTWWSELPAKWTPVGWKNHLFRYNVLFNGMVSAVPDLNPRSTQYAGQGMQLAVFPWDKPEMPGHVSHPQDQGAIIQGWNDSPTPVLWSEWAFEGMLFREEIFGHIPGAGDVERGDEPLFAWMRLSVHDLVEGLPMPERYGFSLKISAPYISTGAMSIRYNLAIDESKAKYPRELKPESDHYDPTNGLRILEPEGKVRLAIAPGQEIEGVQILPNTPTDKDFLIYIPIDVKKGAYVDLLVPMLPTDRDVFDSELALGYNAALDEANRYWSRIPSTAATFDVPEQYFNEGIRSNLKLTEIIAERDPTTGFYSLLTGAWVYADLWATPGAMQCAMLLDNMGYHDLVERYLDMYIKDQGSVIAKGDFYQHHPGSFGPPKSIAACDWTSDHGAVLWAIAQHALIAGNQDYIDRVMEPVVKACEYIRFSRQITGHGGFDGLMPPGMATDQPTQIQSVWADAWNYKGLVTAVRFLKRIGHPRAEEFEAEAADYKATFQAALRKSMFEVMGTWKDDCGKEHRLVPMAVFGAQPFEVRNAFYLDTGPLVLVFAELMDADDQEMLSTAKWFREGPPSKVYRYDSDCWQVPSLHREMSSCEPCFSWNIFHSWQLGDRDHYIEALYSLFTGAVSRQTYIVCETRGGVTGIATLHIMNWLARFAVIDDQIAENELHLLRMTPLAWIRKDYEARFENMPTEYGPITLKARLSDDGKQLRVTFEADFRMQPRQVVLHIPPVDGLEAVVLNGKKLDWDGVQESLIIG